MFDKLIEVGKSVMQVILMMSPYLLLGFVVAGLLSFFFTPAWVTRHLGRRGLWQVVKASLVGVPLPLCSCSVLPLAFSLRKSGAGKGATVSFLASTPQTGVDSIFLTYSLLGPIIALLRIVAAFASGILAGLLTDWVCRDEKEEQPAGGEGEKGCCCCSSETGGAQRASAGPSLGSRLWSREAWLQAAHHAFIVLPRDMAKALLVGVLVSGLITAFVPKGFFEGYVPPGVMGYLVAILIGRPLYVCSASSVPIAALLIQAGVSPGAAMVFLITGPATNSAAVISLWRQIGRRGTLAYLLAICLVAMLSGVLLDAFLPVVLKSTPIMHEHACDPASAPLWQWAAAFVLLGLFIPGLVPSRKKAV